VIIGGTTWPKDRPWIAGIALATVLASACYAVEWSADGRLPGGSSRTGFGAGVVAGAIIVFELLLWPRKRVRSWRLGSAQSWLRAHVWLGLLAVPLVLLHSRLLFVGGLLNLALLALFFAVIASGVWGLVLQQYLPRAILEQVPAETIYDQIEHVSRQQCRETAKLVDAVCEAEPMRGHGDAADDHARDRADDHADGRGDAADHDHDADRDRHHDDVDDDEHAVVTGFRSMTGIQGRVVETLAVYTAIPGTLPLRRRFFADVRPYLLAGKASGSPLAGAAASAEFFAGLRASSPAAAADLIGRLEQSCDQRRQLDLQVRMHEWLHGWLLVHVPLSVALGVLLAIHVPVALWYW